MPAQTSPIKLTPSATPSYWADIAMRSYEALPRARTLGHHTYPVIIPALMNLAAMDDTSNDMAWELDVLTINAGGTLLDTHRPVPGDWGGITWEVEASRHDQKLGSQPRHDALLKALLDQSPTYAVCAWDDEEGEIVTLSIAEMRVAVRPGREGRPTQVIVPEAQAEQFKKTIARSQLLSRFDTSEGAPRPLLPSRDLHRRLGVTDELGNISMASLEHLPEGDREFFANIARQLALTDGDLSGLSPPDLRRFNALRHQHLMPQAMLAPISGQVTHDDAYELSALLCVAGAIYRNLDQEADLLGQTPTLESLERDVRLHFGAVIRQDKANAGACMPTEASTDDPQARNRQLRGQLAGQILSVPDRLPFKATPFTSVHEAKALEIKDYGAEKSSISGHKARLTSPEG
ncbi:hypothetical protein VRRI112168_00515 [Vreelandella rituensis]|uniref:Uncharacterized protein n=1 Tax=Vreelandella rituensis TaxID=2282306 RepID=A0A368U9N7_9GAMM|nr:hypothetical protein [Halomonas rituensis]RCV93820.1 hypothetical protein DU506_01295 [Halomonas rituensis]